MIAVLQVALGGALGAVLRYLTGIGMVRVFGHSAFPLPILTVNVVGSFLMGVFVVVAAHRGLTHLSPLVMTGFLGGFTTFSAFSLGRNQMAYVAAAVLAGGHVRVGLEDNLWLDKGVLAENWQLVERAVTIIENMGARVIGPAEVRETLGLVKQAPKA